MALVQSDTLGGLIDACETARSQLSDAAADAPPLVLGPTGAAVPVRGPRTSRGVKRSRGELLAAHTLLVPTSPGKGKRSSGKRPAIPTLGGAEGGRMAGRRARAPRSPDEKRKLSRQMAAFMRLGVLVLPADVKARFSLRSLSCKPQLASPIVCHESPPGGLKAPRRRAAAPRRRPCIRCS
jgi:hypothetical protein